LFANAEYPLEKSYASKQWPGIGEDASLLPVETWTQTNAAGPPLAFVGMQMGNGIIVLTFQCLSIFLTPPVTYRHSNACLCWRQPWWCWGLFMQQMTTWWTKWWPSRW
jgi:hypothetical protein